MKINSKRKLEIVDIEDDNDYAENEQDIIGDFAYKKYKFIQAFSKLSIGVDEEQSDGDKIDQEKKFDQMYADLAKQFNKNISISYSDRVPYKKRKPSKFSADASNSQIKYISITDGQKDINLFKHQQNNLANVIFNLYQEIQPSSNDSLVVYKGNSMNVLVNSFMNYLQTRKVRYPKLKSKSEGLQKETLKVIIEENEREEEQSQVSTA